MNLKLMGGKRYVYLLHVLVEYLCQVIDNSSTYHKQKNSKMNKSITHHC